MGADTCEVLIVGAGVQGLSAAHNLALRGVADVTVIEALGGAGRGSSGRSASMLMKSRENRPKIQLSLFSYDRFMAFEDEFGEPLEFRKVGFLSLVPPDLAKRYRREHDLRVGMGVPSYQLTVDEISSVCPELELDGIEFGVLGSDDGEINVGQIIASLLRSVRGRGIELCFEERATELEVRNDRVTGVRTSSGRTIWADRVVVAAGAGAVALCSTAQINLPVASRARSLYTLSVPVGSFMGPMVEDAHHEWYYRDLGKGRILMGMGRETKADVSDEINTEFLPEVQAIARLRAPLLADAAVLSGSTGMRPLTPDILPIVGPVDGRDGLILSVGWGGEGIMHSPAGGAMVADWITGSTTPDLPADDFLYSRFNS